MMTITVRVRTEFFVICQLTGLVPIMGTCYLVLMRIIARRTLRDLWEQHPRAEQPLRAWFAEATKATWSQPQDIKDVYRHASFVGDNRVVFNIAGNRYRLIAHINYDYGIVYVKFVGTHAAYDRIDPEKV